MEYKGFTLEPFLGNYLVKDKFGDGKYWGDLEHAKSYIDWLLSPVSA